MDAMKWSNESKGMEVKGAHWIREIENGMNVMKSELWERRGNGREWNEFKRPAQWMSDEFQLI